jgi:hypothetical protein
MRLIAPVLAIAALASGCGNDKPKDPSPPADSPAAKPVEPAQAAKPACDERHAVIDQEFRVKTRVELVCDAGGARVRFMDDDITVEKTEERALTAAEWDAAWKAIDATNWSALPEACGRVGDKGSQTIEVTAGGTTKKVMCIGSAVSPGHEALIDALMAPAKPWFDAESKAAAAVPADNDSIWWIEAGGVGPVRGGMTLAELRALPKLTLKTITVEVPIELEGEEEMGTEQEERIEVWSDGVHQLTVAYSEDKITGIDVYGPKPRVEPVFEEGEEEPAGVGTTAQELEDLYGKPSEWDAENPWAPGACAVFAKERAAKFCFDSKAKRFEQVRKKNLAVKALEVRL